MSEPDLTQALTPSPGCGVLPLWLPSCCHGPGPQMGTLTPRPVLSSHQLPLSNLPNPEISSVMLPILRPLILSLIPEPRPFAPAPLPRPTTPAWGQRPTECQGGWGPRKCLVYPPWGHSLGERSLNGLSPPGQKTPATSRACLGALFFSLSFLPADAASSGQRFELDLLGREGGIY